MIHKKFMACVIMLSAFYSIATYASNIEKKVNASTAQKLAAIAHDGSTKFLNSYDDSDTGNTVPPFYEFMELGMMSDTVGLFAVNPWTGDVWDLWQCKKIGTPASREVQAKIKKGFTPDDLKHYKSLSELKPKCN